MTKVTIISPTYNHESYICQCIDSVLAQNYQDWEMIIINDGSTDGTEGKIKLYNDPRIKYFRQDNIGIMRLGETYNTILGMAKGEICAILECDDYWPPDKLATMVPAFNDPQVVLAYGITRLIAANGQEKGLQIPSQELLSRYPKPAFLNEPVGIASCMMARSDIRTFTFPCALMIRTSTLKEMGGFKSVPDLPFIDYPTFIEIGMRGKYYFVPRIMGYWRQHTNSNTQTRDDYATDKTLRSFVMKFLDKNRPALPLDESRYEEIIQGWSTTDQDNAIRQGRKLLFAKQWLPARKIFGKLIFQEKRPLRKIMAAAGYAASLAHCDIEPIYGLTGRATFNDLRSDRKQANKDV